MASRAASATVLGFLAEHVGNMIVSSADLANSDKTDGFLKKTTVLCKEDFTGGFLQAGVAELTMACIIKVSRFMAEYSVRVPHSLFSPII